MIAIIFSLLSAIFGFINLILAVKAKQANQKLVNLAHQVELGKVCDCNILNELFKNLHKDTQYVK